MNIMMMVNSQEPAHLLNNKLKGSPVVEHAHLTFGKSLHAVLINHYNDENHDDSVGDGGIPH